MWDEGVEREVSIVLAKYVLGCNSGVDSVSIITLIGIVCYWLCH
jgi:hypothetical protein